MRWILLLAGGLVLVTHTATASTVVIGFDDMSAGIIPGDAYADSCVLFTSGRVDDNLVPVVGELLTFEQPEDSFEIFNEPTAAISDPNAAAALFGHDILMTFTEPVTYASITTDEFPETHDTVYLVALGETGNPNEYEILLVTSGSDAAIATPDNLLELSSNEPFSHVMFLTYGEREGFDNLTFRKGVPEPSTIALLGCLAIGFAFLRRRGG